MGNKFSESSKEAKTVAYKVVKGDNDTPESTLTVVFIRLKNSLP